MTFEEALGYLYGRLPVFHNIGPRAYKPGLQTTHAFCKHLGNPQEKYPTIHVAGTNGKGSTSHMLAAVLQEAGYKTGLYTSPHLKSFTERIKINGVPVEEEFIAEFVSTHRSFIESINPSFFEVTVAMAFACFEWAGVDVAVIEVGMGGRVDSTNVINPVLSVITNISFDHMQQLGDTLPEIASEKAGIIKRGVPVVVSERQEPAVMEVFEAAAQLQGADLTIAADRWRILSSEIKNGLLELEIKYYNTDKKNNIVKIGLDLIGSYQLRNILGVLSACEALGQSGWDLSDTVIRSALSRVTALTGLKGRWQRLQNDPLVICDTAHNKAGFGMAIGQFLSIPSGTRHFVLGFVGDKDISGMLAILPKDARYYFCQPSNVRALNAENLRAQAFSAGLKGESFPNVNIALEVALREAAATDTVYVGGSTFVVADLERL